MKYKKKMSNPKKDPKKPELASNKTLIRNFVSIVLSLFLIALLVSNFSHQEEKYDTIAVNKLVSQIQQDEVKKVEIERNEIIVTLNNEDAKQQKLKKEFGESFSELMNNLGVDSEKLRALEVEVKEPAAWKTIIANIVPFLLPFLLIVGVIFYMSRQVQGANNKAMGFGGNAGKQAKPDDKDKKTFKDVAGSEEVKEELSEIVDFLKFPKKFADMGAKIPRGVLMMGPPGTGKTLLAKAVAGEAEVPFFHISGSEFVEMFVGVGASRVRDLFTKAKKAAPSIIFIDEMDAVGRKRGAGLGGGHDEREQTLNQILVEMDGFEPNSGVIVMAATNRPDVLDQALLRPGRFDRRVTVGMPDIKEREAILKVHAKNKPMSKDVDLKNLATRTPGFSGADLANLLNEAAILAVREEKKEVTENMIRESIDKVILGPAKKTRVMSEEDKKMTAYHEAGHAIVGHFLKNCDPVRKVSIIGRGSAGGYTLSMPDSDKHYQRIVQFKDDMAMMMGGYVAERMIYGNENLTTGPSSDLKKATSLAKRMVMQYGMSEKLGPRVYAANESQIFLAQEIHDKKNYSEKIAETIDEEINKLLVESRERAEQILLEKKDKMEKLVEALMKEETVEQERFNQLMK